MSQSPPLLAGVKVVEFCQIAAGPFAPVAIGTRLPQLGDAAGN